MWLSVVLETILRHVVVPPGRHSPVVTLVLLRQGTAHNPWEPRNLAPERNPWAAVVPSCRSNYKQPLLEARGGGGGNSISSSLTSCGFADGGGSCTQPAIIGRKAVSATSLAKRCTPESFS